MAANPETAPEPKLADLDNVRDAFAAVGEDMRIHKGRSVVRIPLPAKTYFLKRFWFTPSQAFKGHVRRGFHELRMIDWLNANGFAGPVVVRRGWSGRPPFCTRMFFLMEEIPNERPLEAAWTKYADKRNGLLQSLATFAARLHEAGFVHTDFSERHILVGRQAESWTFRLIDVERASVGRATDGRVADDLATLATSVMNGDLRDSLSGTFLDAYHAARTDWSAHVDVHTLVRQGQPTKSF